MFHIIAIVMYHIAQCQTLHIFVTFCLYCTNLVHLSTLLLYFSNPFVKLADFLFAFEPRSNMLLIVNLY